MTAIVIVIGESAAGLVQAATIGTVTTPAVDPQWRDNDHMDWGWGAWFVMMVIMALFWGGVTVLVVWVVKTVGGGQRNGTSSALDIARDRYARGEITDEEFQRIKRGLS